MRYKVKWRSGGDGPLTPELLESAEAAKERARQLLKRSPDAQIEIWNEDETWQVVAPAGIAEWCETTER